MPGMTKTCRAKKRDSVWPPMMGPPSIMWTSGPPIHRHAADDGSADAEAPVGVLIKTQHLAGEGHAEREKSRKTPMIQVSSRGNLYAPKRKTCTMWIRTMATMKSDPQP